MKKLVALMLALMLAAGLVPVFAEGGWTERNTADYEPAKSAADLDGPTIRLDVYSQLANYSGIQQGWSATLMKDKFNVEINIIPEQDGTYATRMESGSLGDIVVWGSNGEDYKNAAAKEMLLDWEQYDLGQTYAPYIMENYKDALESNRNISPIILNCTNFVFQVNHIAGNRLLIDDDFDAVSVFDYNIHMLDKGDIFDFFCL